ncbi:hypothetical protein OROGR_010712 [Orobanche gracilis]
MGHFYGSIPLTLADKNQLDLLLLRRLHTTQSIDFSASSTSHNSKQSINFSAWPRLRTTTDVVNIWNLKDYSCVITVPTYEALESVCAFGSASPFVSCLSSFTQKNGKETINSPSIQFVTFGERGVVRIWNSDGAVLLFERKSSDLAVSSKKEEVKRGFTSAMMLPLGQGLLCATVDQQFLIYGVDKHADGGLNLFMRKSIIELCELKGAELKKAHGIIGNYANRGLRSLGVARQMVPEKTKESAGGTWEFVGLLPLFDPPRHDSAETIRKALDLGVNMKMIAGDQLAIGKETGRRLGWAPTCIKGTSDLLC